MPYRSSIREERARHTRREVLAAARVSFIDRGYAGTTMRMIAAGAGVSVPTVELLFGTKAAVLKATIDVAIAGDDEQIPVLDREWSVRARAAGDVPGLLTVVVGVLGAAQERSAGLVLAALEASITDRDLGVVSEQLVAQRAVTAGWIADQVAARSPLRTGLTRADAVDTVWLLMDPAVFVRLTRHRDWSMPRYQDWMARSLRTLLVPDDLPTEPPTTSMPREG
ncbi:TetR/AcrR family transcriptional regulator [Cryptosporangium arvum]|uniref:Transcriptional regulator n=1 Tax=Cryptosporangium arvum DSM 44712 TaxID=927661 RepID=A0A010ZU13_9ACTN|nr:TetR/AcrR family transcriptional regulator [Cryptosporangium arvum]EXG82184.1 transcriptional regulator [Cryptosporangium arvum DSM 44712]